MDVLEKHQWDALEQAYDLLKEHFEASLIVVTATVTRENEEQEATQIYWAGGYMHAVGQAEYARYILQRQRDVRESRPGND